MKWLRTLYRLNLRLGDFRNTLKSGGKSKDSIVLGLLSGLIGTLTMDLSNWVLWRGGKTESLLGRVAGSMFLRPWQTKQRKNFLLGQIAHMITGSALGIPLVYLFKKTGRDLAYLKGAFYASLTWSVLVDGATRLGIYRIKPRMSKTFYASLFDNMLYGLSATFAILRFADRSVIPDKQHVEARTEKSQDFSEYIDDMTPTVDPDDFPAAEAPSYLQ